MGSNAGAAAGSWHRRAPPGRRRRGAPLHHFRAPQRVGMSLGAECLVQATCMRCFFPAGGVVLTRASLSLSLSLSLSFRLPILVCLLREKDPIDFPSLLTLR